MVNLPLISDWALGKISSWTEQRGTGLQGAGRATIPRDAQEPWGCGTEGHGLERSQARADGQRLELDDL